MTNLSLNCQQNVLGCVWKWKRLASSQTASSPSLTQIHTHLSQQTRQLFYTVTLGPFIVLSQNGEGWICLSTSWTSVLSGNTGNPHTAVATDTHWASGFPPGWAQTLRSDTRTLQYLTQDTTASQHATPGATHEVLSFKGESFWKQGDAHHLKVYADLQMTPEESHNTSLH